MNKVIQMPQKVKYIIETLQQAGFEAYAVGGCVRDSLLDRKPSDWDITTSARPIDVKDLFKRTVDTGILHGTVTIMLEKEGFEVTTYRIDGEYEDSRHPKEVIFTANLIEDLKRRDFTINAMAYNDKEGLVDTFQGIEDLEKKLIRCVGDPKERFNEDALRIMRAIRFSAQLGYEIEQETRNAIEELVPTLKNISAERIQVELLKTIISPNPYLFKLYYETGITKVIMPEFDLAMETSQNNPHHSYTVGEHILKSMEQVPGDKLLRLAMLFHDLGKPQTQSTDEKGISHFDGHAFVGEKIAANTLRNLKFDNDTISKVTRMVRFHDAYIEADEKAVRRSITRFGEDIFPLILQVKKADISAQSTYRQQEKLDHLSQVKKIYEEIIARKDCVSLKNLALSGKDLIELGMKPGREIGIVLDSLLDVVLDFPEYNTKEYLLEYYQTKFKELPGNEV